MSPERNTGPTTCQPVKRPYLQFSLRGLMLLTTILCVWLGWQAHRAREQRDVVAYLNQLNHQPNQARGSWEIRIEYDRGLDESWAPAWLLRSAGGDFFQNVTAVRLSDRVTREQFPAAIAQLARLPRLLKLELFNTPIVDDDLRHLTTLTRLRQLTLSFPGPTPSTITGQGIRQLTGMDSLRELSMSGRNMQTEALRYVPMFKSLRSIAIGGYGIYGEVPVELAAAKSLTAVSLRGCRCKGSTLARIAEIKTLQRLYLTNMDISYRYSLRNGQRSKTNVSPEDWPWVPTWQDGRPMDWVEGQTLPPSAPSGSEFIDWIKQKHPGLEVGLDGAS